MPYQRSHWRHGGSSEGWPTDWNGPVLKWPTLDNDLWVPDHEGPCVIVCVRGPGVPMQLVSYETAAQAADADWALYDRECGPSCLRLHYRIWCTPSELHVERGVHDPAPMPDNLGAALRAAGYHPPDGVKINGTTEVIRPADCPHPTRLNPPLGNYRRVRRSGVF
jgi:hypothetical protein